ncbi:hypothetical protein CCYN49044_90025 [Capnocytophaga cynodegmi]|uniref:Uncharacterized protein n=1 Tax=Capnocytophaga cynodegmi TaxID=28189 RepID=A0A0B7HRJ3_9FLAO|nr:hypothetical protein CCYN74_20008 [Capnocytophaga cynodegmi]CEN42301.1 hypothetical protein CCYN49044_90025 [Capnocytophaga cynodegmi]
MFKIFLTHLVTILSIKDLVLANKNSRKVGLENRQKMIKFFLILDRADNFHNKTQHW